MFLFPFQHTVHIIPKHQAAHGKSVPLSAELRDVTEGLSGLFASFLFKNYLGDLSGILKSHLLGSCAVDINAINSSPSWVAVDN